MISGFRGLLLLTKSALRVNWFVKVCEEQTGVKHKHKNPTTKTQQITHVTAQTIIIICEYKCLGVSV